MSYQYIRLAHESLYFRYKNPENYYHFLIYMISNLRHIDYNAVHTVYFQHLHPQLIARKNSYMLDVLKLFLPKLQRIKLVTTNSEKAYELKYIPEPDTLGRGEPYAIESYMFIRQTLLPIIQRFSIPACTKIYVSRNKAEKRKIINEEEFTLYLIRRGFKVLFLEDLGGIEQMAYFYNASIVISPHGTGLTNILFCKPNTRIIEIASSAMNSLQHFQHIANTMSLDYIRFGDVIADPENINSNMIVNIDTIEKCLQNSKS